MAIALANCVSSPYLVDLLGGTIIQFGAKEEISLAIWIISSALMPVCS
jgi:hypothetical protein